MSAGRTLLLLTLVGVTGVAAWYYLDSSTGGLAMAASDIEAAAGGWASVNEGPTWVPVINAAESSAGIPTNLLAAMAYQESSFLPAVITGTQASSAGALGILQLEPAYFSTVQVPIPFTAADTTAQITQAAQQLASLYSQFSDWGLAVAAYNAGSGTVADYVAGTGTLPTETVNYVADVLTNVPVQTTLQV